jgi:Reverse transcriptase (RNA-dependent DNA polymerase).
LYGCIQASKLWYDNLIAFLKRLGYEVCPTDRCVLRKVVGEKVHLLLVYVDDILIIAEDNEIERIKKAFTDEFQWITFETGDSLSYLGMQISVRNRKVTVDMSFYIDKILEDFNDYSLEEKTNPGSQNTFEVSEDSPNLDKQSHGKFHSTVAKLLYLSKRARPDIMTIVSFLCTRVQSPTDQDF